MKAYNEDLRNKIREHLDKNGGKKIHVCTLVVHSKEHSFRWLKLRKETGGFKANVRKNQPKKVDDKRLETLIMEQPDATHQAL